MTDTSTVEPSVATKAAQAVTQHPTTASAGLGGSLSVVILSLFIHCNIHLTTEEAIAWTSLITMFFGWLLRYLTRRFPILEIPTDGASS